MTETDLDLRDEAPAAAIAHVEFAPWDGRRVPVTLVGGYLGAGKTTLINRLLARTDRPIAVLVNDVGAVNIDAKLIRRRSGDTIELTDGCVCCEITRGLADAFDSLRARPEAPDHVVVELSGVADPRRVVPWASSIGFRLDSVVVLVDTPVFAENWDDSVLGHHLRAQVAAADLIALTKTDTAAASDRSAATAILDATVPGVPIIDSAGVDDLAALVDTATRRGGVADTGPPQLFDAHQVDRWPVPDPISMSELDALLARLPADTVRAKGIVGHHDASRSLVQVVGKRIDVTPLPTAELEEPTGLVVITLPR